MTIPVSTRQAWLAIATSLTVDSLRSLIGMPIVEVMIAVFPARGDPKMIEVGEFCESDCAGLRAPRVAGDGCVSGGRLSVSELCAQRSVDLLALWLNRRCATGTRSSPTSRTYSILGSSHKLEEKHTTTSQSSPVPYHHLDYLSQFRKHHIKPTAAASGNSQTP